MTGKKPAPSVVELEVSLTAAQQRLLAAHRANSTARTTRPALLAQGNDIAIAENRREISATAKQVRELTEEVEFASQAIESAKQRDHALFNQMRLRTIEKLMAVAVADHCELERTIDEFGKVLIAASASAAEAEAELQRSGIPYDRYLSIATRIKTRAEMCVWLATDGAMGRQPTLDTASQLRASGRASLKLAATEFRGLVMRTARLKFGCTDQPNEAA
jgi:hypothetical protein